jgi:RNA polymerase sigma factor (sigma-70 family)
MLQHVNATSRTGRVRRPLVVFPGPRAADQRKWLAVEDQLRVMVSDDTGRAYLRHWARNLRENPPHLDTIAIREHYNLLKREQGALLEKGTNRAALIACNRRLRQPPDREKDLASLVALDLTGPLVAGLAEVLLGEAEASDMAAALTSWQQVWAEPQRPPYFVKQEDTCRAIRGNLEHYYGARALLITHNLRLVYAIAGKISARGLPYEELVQGGMLGLIRAAEKFHYKKGYRFSTYAYNWIKQSMQQQTEDSLGVLRYPASVHEDISRLYREQVSYRNAKGREPGSRWLAGRLGLDHESFERLRQVNNLAVPLDTRVGEPGDGLSLAETLPGSPTDEASLDANNRSLGQCLLRTMQDLKPVEREVVSLRWGLANLTPLTRGQVADRLQVSTEWVRQLEKSALEKLKRNKGLAEAYGDYLASR